MEICQGKRIPNSEYMSMKYLQRLQSKNVSIFVQVSMWLLAVGVGMVCGKTIIHGIVLSRWLRLKMFRNDQV